MPLSAVEDVLEHEISCVMKDMDTRVACILEWPGHSMTVAGAECHLTAIFACSGCEGPGVDTAALSYADWYCAGVSETVRAAPSQKYGSYKSVKDGPLKNYKTYEWWFGNKLLRVIQSPGSFEITIHDVDMGLRQARLRMERQMEDI